MKKRLTFILIILFALGAGLSAQDIFISWLDGDVQVIQGSDVFDAAIGDEIDIDARIRLAAGALLELEANGNRIMLNSPGEYVVRRLFPSNSGESQGVLSALASRVDRINSGDQDVRTGSAVGGVRAADASEENIEWAGGDAGKLFAKGLALLQDAKIDQAYNAFEEAYFMANDAELSEAAFYLGYAAVLKGNLQEGQELYQEASFGPEDGPLYYLYLLSSADLSLKMEDYSRALDTLSVIFQAENISDGDLQMAYYYRAMAYSGLGKSGRMSSDLRKVTELNSNPQLTAIAEAILWKDQ